MGNMRGFRRWCMTVLWVGLMGLLITQTGCGRIMGADALVQRAVTLEVLRTQVAIAQEYNGASASTSSSEPSAEQSLGQPLGDSAGSLPTDFPVAVDTLEAVSTALGVRVRHIRVQERLPLTVGDRPGFKISGTYDLDLDRDGWETHQRRSPFEIYLQRQPENKTWKLAHLNPGDGDQPAVWELYRL
ncbi:MAG: hypothetical protein AAGF75_11120 [Cyanobacteria bacterium P01_H01_bin.130]